MDRTTSTDARTKRREGADRPHTPELERGGLAVLSVRLRIAVSKDGHEGVWPLESKNQGSSLAGAAWTGLDPTCLCALINVASCPGAVFLEFQAWSHICCVVNIHHMRTLPRPQTAAAASIDRHMGRRERGMSSMIQILCGSRALRLLG